MENLSKGSRKRSRSECGPEEWEEIAPLTPFEQACKVHDDDYENPELSREDADFKFLKASLELAGPKLIRVWWVVIYYTLVRMFGWVKYESGKN